MTPRGVTLVSTDFHPMLGGVAVHLHRLSNALARRMPVTVVSAVPCASPDWSHDYTFVSTPPLPERRLNLRIGDAVAPIRKLHTGRYFLALRGYARRTLAGAITGNAAVMVGIWDTAAHFWCEECRRSKTPYYVVLHGVELLLPLYGRLPAWRAGDLAGAERVIANSEATAALARQRFALAHAPAIVHPSVGPRPPVTDLESRARDLRRTLSIGAGPVVLSVGRLVPRKGFDLVLASIAELRATVPSLRYLIAGEGPERSHLEAIVEEYGLGDCVRFLGAVDEVTKWSAYELCDIFAMPNRRLGGSDWEGFGIVFLEAALAGRPSIAGHNGGAADAVKNARTGLLVDPERPGALTQALRELLLDTSRRRQLGANAAAMARCEFTADRSVDRLCDQLGW